jgi:hypothetical protein
MKPLHLGMIVLLSAGVLSQRASAGPFDAIRSFFNRPQQQQPHVVHHRHPPKEAKDAPSESPSPLLSPAPQSQDGQPQPQPNTSPGPSPVSTVTTEGVKPEGVKRQGPTIAAAPLY